MNPNKENVIYAAEPQAPRFTRVTTKADENRRSLCPPLVELP